MTTKKSIILIYHIILNHSSNIEYLICLGFQYYEHHSDGIFIHDFCLLFKLCPQEFGQIAKCAKLFPSKSMSYQFTIPKRGYE